MGEGKFVTAGNASQLSDGAAAVVVMEAAEAARRGLTPLGAFRGFAVAGCEPDEMGIGPVYAVPRLLERHGLKVDDIDLWELNEAFASSASTAATSWASIRRSTTSTAARSPSATPSA
jgi:acetyl-CoA C-acetyltransferase